MATLVYVTFHIIRLAVLIFCNDSYFDIISIFYFLQKLGRGGSEGCFIPQQIERLNDVGVIQIECGAQFSLALTKSGEIWTWGKVIDELLFNSNLISNQEYF